ncbi:MAG: hypothetical protein WCA84_05155, partial [Ignavibacteriaceae bacterium]
MKLSIVIISIVIFINPIFAQKWVLTGLENESILSIIVNPLNSNIILTGVQDDGIYISSDKGNSWSHSQGRMSVYCLALDRFNNQVIYAGTDNEILVSRDGGNYFNTLYSFQDNITINCIVIDETQTKSILIGTSKGIYKSFDRGRSFIKAGLEGQNISSLAVNNSGNKAIIFAATMGGGIFKTANYGTSWISINNGINDLPIYSIICNFKQPSNLFASTLESGVFISTNDGNNWNNLNIEINKKQGIIISQSVDSVQNLTAIFIINFSGEVLISKNSGQTWEEVNNNITLP